MRFAITFGGKYDSPDRQHPASSEITSKSYVVIYTDTVLDPNPYMLDETQREQAIVEAEMRARLKVQEVLGSNDYAFIYCYDKMWSDEFSRHIRNYDLVEVVLPERSTST